MIDRGRNLDYTPEEAEFARHLRSGSHPSPALLRAAAEGVLPDETKSALQNHLRQCEVCSVLARELSQLEPQGPSEEQLRNIRARLPQTSLASAPIRLFGLRPALLLAGLAGLIVAVGATIHWWPRTEVPRQQVARVAGLPLREFAVAKAPIDIPAALLPTRGTQNENMPQLQEWSLALKPYQGGDFARAVASLESIAQKYPNFADGYFYLGVSQLMLQRNEDAAKSLETARGIASGERLSQVQWYLGAAYARLGRTEDAINQWRPVCDGGGAYAKESCGAISRFRPPSHP